MLQAVILAAGKGTRLKAKTDTLPKAMIEIEHKPLLEYSLDSLSENGIADVILVVGFRHETITRRYGTDYRGLKIRYVFNDNFAGSGSMYSLALARDIIEDEILLLESDLLYESRAISRLLNDGHPNSILVAGVSGSGDEVYICANQKQEITELGKNIPMSSRETAIGELAGISRFKSNFLQLVFSNAQKDFQNGTLNYHYEDCVFRTSQQTTPIHAVPGQDLAWIEIDTAEDLLKARKLIHPLIRHKEQQS
ncbi:MAG: phosphocholine cytidylyltransferase family protein [Desulfobacterales bacterium]|jgi:2-aminoethylphosphonate-pyruvate transaminase